jgi:bacterioferritin
MEEQPAIEDQGPSQKVGEALLRIIVNEHKAIVQYKLHSAALMNQGYTKLAKKIDDIALEEMGHLKVLLARANYLGLDPVKIGQAAVAGITVEATSDVETMLHADLITEQEGIALDQEVTKLAADMNVGSRPIVEDILVDEEEHALFFEQQIFQVQMEGIENYLSSIKE